MRVLCCLSLLLAASIGVFAQNETWTPQQLMEPAELAARLAHPEGNPALIVCVGPSGIIKGSVEAGAAHEAASLNKLKALVEKEKRDREVIIYCGCCPFDRCPNVRPAMALMREMHFTHARLLNLAHNIRTDWIAHGYPVKDN